MQRMLLTPEGKLPYDPAALAEAINRLHEVSARDLVPAPSFPRVEARNRQWCRQNIPGGRWWPIPLPELHELLGLEEAA